MPSMQIPTRVLESILINLGSRDILAFSSTCSQMYVWTCWAYHSVHFELGQGTVDGTLRTLSSFEKLLEVLRRRPEFQTILMAISLYDTALSQPAYIDPHYSQLLLVVDNYIGQITALATNLRSFIMDASTTGLVLAMRCTFQSLLSAPNLQELALIDVSCPPDLLPDSGGVTSTGLRRVLIRGGDFPRFNVFLRGQEGLHKLDFRGNACHSQQWLEVFESSAGCWNSLEDLSISCEGEVFADNSGLVQLCLGIASWSTLTTLSISVQFRFEHLVMLAKAPLRCLRLVVNFQDNYVPEFGPRLMGGVLTCFPGLEELVLDHLHMTQHAPLLDHEYLAAWCDQIRNAARLRVLVLPTLFVLDSKALDDDDDCLSVFADNGSSDGNSDRYEDVEMDVDAGLSVSQTSQPITMLPEPIAPFNSLHNIDQDLAIWAEDFFDIHLRSLNLEEIWFIHDYPDAGHRETVGYEQEEVEFALSADIKRTGFVPRRNADNYEMFWEPGWRQVSS